MTDKTIEKKKQKGTRLIENFKNDFPKITNVRKTSIIQKAGMVINKCAKNFKASTMHLASY